MGLAILVGVALELASGAQLVDVSSTYAHMIIDLRYATPRNFTKRALYPAGARCFLRRAVAERLARVQAALELEGFGLKLWDCYRPLSVQRLMWKLVPDERYVADPAKGSRHNRGAAVDVTLVDKRGAELPMPTPFDDFSERAHRDFNVLDDKLPGESAAALENRDRLERAMKAEGFVPLPTEWWHFDAPDWASYPIADDDLASLSRAARIKRPH
jgi:D-alanyl-D-alanine dipeptidase